MIFSLRSFFLISFIGIFICGCSGNSTQPVSPDNPDSSPGLIVREELDSNSSGSGHYLMQYGYIFIDPDHPDGSKAEVIPARVGEFHLNILKFIEISPCMDCFRVVGFDFPEPGKLNIDIQIDHPFDQLDYSVFDVRAIMMFQGSHVFPTSGKTISDPALGDGAVLNPDGYTALFNGSTVTAPVGDLLKYSPGNLATPVVPDSDINGYKYFITDDPLNNRNAFYAGTSVVQTFELQLPDGSFVIGYAVDASMLPPITSPVDDPLTDFDVNANCIEPWKVVVTEEQICDGLTEQGDETKLLIDVYDWKGKWTHKNPVVECPEIFNGIIKAAWAELGTGYTRFEAIISNDNFASIGSYICLVAVEAIENNPTETPWFDFTAYQIASLDVNEESPVGPGRLIWAKNVGGNSADRAKGHGITTLSDNSTVVSGYFTGSATFGSGEPNETILTNAGHQEIFIARYNPDGILVWAKNAGGASGGGWGYGITTLSDNSTVVTGHFGGSTAFGPGEPDETILISAGHKDIFIARYNPDGTLTWAKRAGGTSVDQGYEITTLSENSTVVTGTFSGSATFGSGEPNETILTNAGIFITRYNPDGTLAWAKSAGGTSAWGHGYGITTLSDDTTVVTGGFQDSVTFGMGEPNQIVLTSAGGSDIFIARYNLDGTLAWAKRAGGTSGDKGSGITTALDNSTVVTGQFYGSATFGLDELNQIVLTSATDDNYDIFIACYNPDGTLAWAKSSGGTNGDHGLGITTISDNSTVVTGGFVGSATFGPGEPNQVVLTAAGSVDTFIARYNPDGTIAWARSAGGATNYLEWGNGITMLSDNSTVATGFFQASTTFGPCEPNETVLNAVGFNDIFIARFAE